MGDKKKRKAKSKKRKAITGDQILALKYVQEWALPNHYPVSSVDDGAADADFLPATIHTKASDPNRFEFHCHSKHSDGFFSPSVVVERAHRNGVKVLALTDHDTLAGIPEAIVVAEKYGIRVIPGVEISSVHNPKQEPGTGEGVHVLAYYGSCGPSNYEELDKLLSNIRDGRYVRARNMLLKLNKLKVQVKWEDVTEIAGDGVAPGRVHVARALVQAGYVANLREAFNRFLYDGGPAYAIGSEPCAEAVVHLIRRTGGLAALAHPWSLKNPDAVIRSLKSAGLHAMEVYRSDGKVAGFDELADKHELIKIGGSDYHGKGEQNETDIGTINLPVVSLYRFLKTARPVWHNAAKDILLNLAEDPSDENIKKIMWFMRPKKDMGISDGKFIFDSFMSLCLANDSKEEDADLQAIRIKLAEALNLDRE